MICVIDVIIIVNDMCYGCDNYIVNAMHLISAATFTRVHAIV